VDKKVGKSPENIDFFRISTFSSSSTANATTKPNNILIEKENKQRRRRPSAMRNKINQLVLLISLN
jgi:hypothetical protein